MISTYSVDQVRVKPGWLAQLIFASLCLGFLGVKLVLQDLQAIHVLFTLLILGLYWVHPLTRRWAILGLPLVVFGIVYDSLRYIPFTWLQTVHVAGPYLLDAKLFGVTLANGNVQHLHDFLFQCTQSLGMDLLTGFVYFMHIPAIFVFFFSFWKWKGDDLSYQYAFAMLVMNLLSFITYLSYPAAAPWYVEKFGFAQPLSPMLGDAAGLSRIDQWLGVDLFSNSYLLSPIIFGAVPSMHVGFATLGWLFSFQVNRRFALGSGLFLAAMIFSALYLKHHYFIDVLLGFLYGLVTWWLIYRWLSPYLLRFNQRCLRFFVVEERRPR